MSDSPRRPASRRERLSKERVLSGAMSIADRGGLQLGRVGAVAEGLIAGVVGLGILLLVIRLTGSRS